MYVGLRKTQGLHDDVVNFILDSLRCHLPKPLLQIMQYVLVRALTTHIICIFASILHKITRLFINRIVGQMHAKVAQIRRSRTLILDRCKASQAIFVDVDA